jgi:hypothetical protein
MTLKEFMPVMPIVAMGIFASVLGIFFALRERKASRKEREESQHHSSGAASR